MQEEALGTAFSFLSRGNETAQIAATPSQISIRAEQSTRYAKSVDHRTDRLWRDIGRGVPRLRDQRALAKASPQR
jgi:hypothetical protein